MMENTSPDDFTFIATLDRLRTQESLVLQPVLPQVSAADEDLAVEFLEREYERECLEYPANSPEYDGVAAQWAARTIYYAGHLLLHRHDMPEALASYLPPFEGDISTGAILSADLCLRFLPALLKQGQRIDPEDMLLPLLEERLRPFGYSGLGYFATCMPPATWQEDDCVQQLCVDRMVGLRLTEYLEDHTWRPRLLGSMGAAAGNHWPQAAKRMEL